jgi:hypothetical protein
MSAKFLNKEALPNKKALLVFSGRPMKYSSPGQEDFFPYFRWNFSTLPAVSTNNFLPVKKGCDAELTSTLINGYSFPSSHFMVSLECSVDFVMNLTSLEVSWKTTSLYAG